MDPSVSRDAAMKSLAQLVDALNSPGGGQLRRAFADDVVWTSDLFDLDGTIADSSLSGREPVAEQMDLLRGAFKAFAFGIPRLARVDGQPPEPLENFPDEIVVFENGRAAFEFEVDGRDADFLPMVGTTHRDTNFRGSALVTFNSAGQILELTTTWNCARIMGQLGRHAHGRPGPN